ncbi:DMT family transporter [Cupriavidus basilensis]|uniref:DMT family transporter n=1 Tax=Cupriavidus basilensis TaxID=68895 RepID=A0ABT6AFQ1_9BURK|nr:DMT family transporter [Cupriavidus basilensis]MDF3831436.1 DMT family transporter [Cupriavidus basilensis]
MKPECEEAPSLPPTLGLALAMLIIGTVGAFATEAGLDPVTTVFWRCVFATIFLGTWCFARGHLPDRSLSCWGLAIATLGGVCMVLSWVAFFAGFAMTTIATTTIVYHIQPFFVVLFGILFLKERVTLFQLMWMFGAFLGVVLASGVTATPLSISERWFSGIGLTLVAALLYAVATILAKQLRAQRPEVTAFCQTLAGIILLVPFAGTSIPPASWGWLIGIGVLHTGIAYVLMYASYPRLSTPAIGVLTFIYPLVAILIDWSIYDHALGWSQGVGLVLIVISTLGFKLGWRVPLRASQSA